MNNPGDHATTYTPKGLEVQKLLRNYKDNHLVQQEIDWIENYIAGERESNDDLIDPKTGLLVNHTYTLYQVPIHDVRVNVKKTDPGFSTFLFRAISAKANIGLATNDGWIFNMILDIYQRYYDQNNGKYQVTETSDQKAMFRLKDDQRDLISFSYTQALQDFVVRGVKHTD